METSKEAIELLLETGRFQRPIVATENKTFTVLPNGTALDLTDKYPPNRIRQRIDLLTAESFVDYVKAFKNNSSIILADVSDEGAKFRAVIDYHSATGGQPDYCCHVATYATKTTPEWDIWRSRDRKAMTQLDFATFIEDNIQLFQSPENSGAPSPIELQELILNLHGHSDARFTASHRLDNGQAKVSYEEEVGVAGTLRGADMVLPAIIIGGFALLVGSANYAVKARLKTRICDRKLVLFYETINPYLLMRDAIKDAIKAIETGTELKPFIGALA